MAFDPTTANADEWIAEKDRREQLRARGALRFDECMPRGEREATLALPAGSKRTSASRHVLDDGVRRVTLPWSTLISDNRKYAPVLRGSGLRVRARMILTTTYREAYALARECINEQLSDRPLLTGRLALVATLYAPPARGRKRDVANHAKFVQDCMNGVVYKDDEQIDDSRWIRGPNDVDRPRLEITVTQL